MNYDCKQCSLLYSIVLGIAFLIKVQVVDLYRMGTALGGGQEDSVKSGGKGD